MSASFSWSTRREGNSGFVLETHPDGSKTEFGPMPCNLVMKFVSARRQFTSSMMRGKGFSLSTEPGPDWKFLQ